MQRVERLRDRDYLQSEAHWSRRFESAFERFGPVARALERKVWRLGIERGIPLYVKAFGPSMVQIWHAQWQDALARSDWDLMDHVIHDFSVGQRLGLSPLGESPRGGWWEYDEQRLHRLLFGWEAG